MVFLNCDLPQITHLSSSDDLPVLETSHDHRGPVVDFDLDPVSGENLAQLKAWPNPASGNITLSFESAIEQLVQVKLINALGQVVMNEQFHAIRGFNTSTANLEQFSPGSYMIQVNTEREMQTKGIVILGRDYKKRS
jgi:hypothetical protein